MQIPAHRSSSEKENARIKKLFNVHTDPETSTCTLPAKYFGYPNAGDASVLIERVGNEKKYEVHYLIIKAPLINIIENRVYTSDDKMHRTVVDTVNNTVDHFLC